MSQTTIRKIWEAINSGNFKVAEPEIRGELDKNPDNFVFLSLSALLASRQNIRLKAIEQAHRVLKSGPTNLVVISIIDEVFAKYRMYDEVCQLYEAADRKATNKRLQEVWYDSMTRIGSAKGLVKVSIALQKQTQSRQNALNVAFNMYLASAIGGITDKEKSLNGLLAKRHLDRVLPVKGIQEAYVYAQVLALSSPKEAAAYLLAETQKQESLDLTCLLVELLEKNSQWKELYDYCAEYLANLANMDNWVHWSRLVVSSKKLGYVEKTEKFIKTFARPGRNSRLALVCLFSGGNKDKFIDAIRTYYTAMENSRCVYEDLHPYVHDLEPTVWLELITADGSSSLETRATVAKFRALVEGPTVKDNTLQYMETAHLLKDKPSTDYHAGDDFMLIAALKVLEEDSPGGLEKAAVLLEVAARNDKHQFYVRLWLIRIYLLLGCFTQALTNYHALSIKTLQHESIAHILMSRLSTIYPSRAPLSKVHDIYDQASEMGPYLKYAYENGAYTRILGLVELQNKLNNSLNEQLFNIEHARLDRLLLGSSHNSKVELPLLNVEYQDNRDFDTMFEICPIDKPTPLSRSLTVGPTPSITFLRFNTARESVLRQLMACPITNSVNDEQVLAAHVDASDLTEAESQSGTIVLNLVGIAKSPSDDAAYSNLVKSIDSYTARHLVISAMGWELPHRVLVALDIAAAVHGYLIRLRGLKSQNKISTGGLESSIKRAADLATCAKELAASAKSAVTEGQTAKCRALGQWATSVGLEEAAAHSTVDGIVNSQAQTLMQIRGLKVAGA